MTSKACVKLALIGVLITTNLQAMDTAIKDDVIHFNGARNLSPQDIQREISRSAEEIEKQDQLYHRVFLNAIERGTLKELNTNLYFAAQNGLIRTAMLLIEKNADIQSQAVNGWVGFTPLHAAVFYNRAPMVSFLLSRNASIEAKAQHDLTPLHVAAFHGRTEAIKILLQHNANMQAKTDEGVTPEELALIEDKVKAYKLLRANVKKCSSCGTISKRKCSRCEKVYYCDRTCQTNHWPTHKSECKKG